MSSPTLPTALSVPAKAKSVKRLAAEMNVAPLPESVRALSRSARATTFLLLAITGSLTDLISKQLIFQWRTWNNYGAPVWLVTDYFGIETSVNRGALFGMGAGYTALFVVLSAAALIVISYVTLIRAASIDRWLLVTLGLITGGIIGNLYDRLGLWHTIDTPPELKYGVRDWILFQCKYIPLRIFNPWPNFNIADCLLVVGAGMLAVYSWRAESEAATTSKA